MLLQRSPDLRGNRIGRGLKWPLFYLTYMTPKGIINAVPMCQTRESVMVIIIINTDDVHASPDEPMIMNEYGGDGECLPASDMVWRPNRDPRLPGAWVSIRDLIEEYQDVERHQAG